ncbi:MAG: hypothetical protein E6371_14735 [Terrisporobacter othiniensis]|uniref:Uncharacterized protein n=2 Tax=Terrisporobacter TaxID=1505652 RepID=A0A0B3WS51_9FIRM|nr:hypothetical protein [Terrisporobacter othiniensis]KHS57385.1 hypothetical protein QX51_08540 [Terrisporobacter othiniensis]MDU6985665.1 hypothetical protein [Terrisporobacter othiniensis]MDY3372799.1 hypothetical protein [Terrisporobacter othiniensis]
MYSIIKLNIKEFEIIDLRDKAKNLKLDISVVYIALKRNEYSDIVRIKMGGVMMNPIVTINWELLLQIIVTIALLLYILIKIVKHILK